MDRPRPSTPRSAFQSKAQHLLDLKKNKKKRVTNLESTRLSWIMDEETLAAYYERLPVTIAIKV